MAMTLSQQLQRIMQAEQYTASQLLEILIAEREALMKSESDTIEKMTANKQPLTV